MCKTTPLNFNELKSTAVAALMKDFPKCGVRFKTEGDYGLVLVHPDIRNQALVMQKRESAKIKATKEVFIVNLPRVVTDIFRVNYIPTLTDVVA
tara:strand:+ start:307 stop:588 length:282 start_codon:yes stop_codon:yes gene_type:complete